MNVGESAEPRAASVAVGAPTRTEEARLSAQAAQIAAWATLALIDAVTIFLQLPAASAGGRALHHLYDAGQLLAAGLLSAAVVDAWARWGPRRRRARTKSNGETGPLKAGRANAARGSLGTLGYLALAAIGVGVGVFVLPGDLGGTAHKLASFAPERLWLGLLVVAVGLSVPLTVRLGSLLACGLATRLVGVALGLGLGITNELILLNNYASVHLFLAWVAALALGAVLTGAPLPRLVRGMPKTLVNATVAPLALIATASVIVPPPHSVNRRLQTIAGAVVAPLFGQMREAWSGPSFPAADVRPDLPSSGPPLVRGAPIVILFVVDALRADVVAGGAHADLLPNIEALRRESVEFTMARAPASGTIWTITSLFSSRYYSQLYWTPKPGAAPTRAYPHEDPSVRFPEILTQADVDTFTVTPMPDIENEGGPFGVTRGVVEESLIQGPKQDQGAAQLAALLARVRRPGTRPLFAYAHFLDAHAPYDAGSGNDPFARYLAEVAQVDAYLGTFRAALAKAGLADRTILVLAADHGEAFGEHQTTWHAVSVYEELLRVPLLVHVPGLASRQVATPVSLLDLGPTVLDLFGQPTPGTYMGQSLVPFLRGATPVLTRTIAAETGRLQRTVVSPDGFKVIEDLRRDTLEAYDLATDPGELVDVVDDPDPRVEARVREMREFFGRNALRREGYRPPYRP